MSTNTTLWTVWDNREIVSRHSAGLDAHKSILSSRHASPDSGRKLWLYDPQGRLVAAYVDGREQLDELSGTAFPPVNRGLALLQEQASRTADPAAFFAAELGRLRAQSRARRLAQSHGEVEVSR